MSEQPYTLEDAKAWLRTRVYDGEHCPCCTQWAKVYRWSLYATATRALVLYHRLGGTSEFVHSNRLKALGHKGQGDAARLRLWGLVERQPNEREDGGRSGYWRVTTLGEQFLRGEVSLPKYAFVYDDKLLRFDGPPVTIRDTLGDGFRYDDMMASAPTPEVPL